MCFYNASITDFGNSDKPSIKEKFINQFVPGLTMKLTIHVSEYNSSYY